MPYRPISNDLKECAICLWGSGWRLEDICDALGVSSRSCYRWRQILEEHGSVNRPPSPLTGHAQTVTRALLTAMEDLFSEHPDLYLDEICTWLAVKHDIDLSTSSLSRTLNSVGLSRKMLQKLASERNELWHSEFQDYLRENFIGDGSEFVIVDETSKNERTYARHYGHAPCGRRAQLRDVFVRGTRYSLCAALTTEGYIASHVIEGTYDTQQFYDFIAEEVLPQMNPFPAEHSVLILDNCRIHRNDALVELVENAGCIIKYLPPYSPDLTPIEESFSCLKAHIRRHAAEIHLDEDPVIALMEATSCVTAEKAYGWFKHAGYIFE